MTSLQCALCAEQSRGSENVLQRPEQRVNGKRVGLASEAEKDNPKMIQILLDFSANPNIADPLTGRFPVHGAALGGSVDTLIVLLKGKAYIHIPDNEGCLPMDLAPSHVVTDLQARGILSDSKEHIMQDTMEPMIAINSTNIH
ncbi:unnamed protein product [Ranitomeya imitator]|uniref:Uncharacterized protein n=1 Tax=Ranitomeya imitator TaxID=111125 RepID=A0ABN9LR00_9NEOB|nr:unnamed protein product [Ranitomeya imitator]